MSLNTKYDALISALENAGYKVFNSAELARSSELYVDILNVTVKENFTGGYTFDINIVISFAGTDRSNLLSQLEDIIKIVDSVEGIVERVEVDSMPGEEAIFGLIIVLREVISIG